MTFIRAIYTAVVYAILPAALARLHLRARREPGYGDHVAERFGRYGSRPAEKPTLWLHAVSVGETRAAEPLVRELLARYPDHRLVLTHMTPTGRRTGEELFGDRVTRAYLPYDYPGAVSRFLQHFAPRAGVLMETEIWPNLIHACSERAIPLYLVNARMSEKSYRGYARFARLVRDSLGRLRAVAAQSTSDAMRLQALGAERVSVTGNLKFDVEPTAAQLELGAHFRASYGGRRVLLAASTREGEEGLLLDQLASLASAALLVIVPRHPQRFDEVAGILDKRRIAYTRRSGGVAATSETRVVLGDSMGEMAAYYAAADVAYIGGSLLPFGGQNLIEACAVGTPVVVGPHTYNFSEATQAAIDEGAALRVESAAALMKAVCRLLSDPDALLRMSTRGRDFTRAHQGATQRTLEVLGLTDTNVRK